ncbi:pyrroline-5-carboxylate reductase 1, mitochondrial-like [Mercenaria mercenaria]|uniref:pyrroline-5-carboxylate reductase 1, mitochondrial-like n=1 Tax=Mercenaria mercenaria TaxID=6596 RepID=UPI00234F1583|nr:pyrroline-5-carboxylate reductase 1, mitochondrial-like [Mercenaria mercenaria]
MASAQRSRVPPDMAVGFIGAGRMAQAMARGFITSGIIKAGNITASDPDPRMLNYIKKNLGINITDSNKEVVQKSQMIVLAVKPNVVSLVLQEVSPTVSKEKLVVSIAGGIPISFIEKNLPEGSKVIRVMPNTPALVLAAASVLAPGKEVDSNDTELVIELLQCFGIVEPGSEKLLDAVTGLSGSGPAYAFTAIEALSDGGVKMGLPRDLAIKLAAQTLLGAAKMVLETGKHPGQLKDEVCSPGGTTIAAMHKLERGGFRATLIDAVEAATLRAKELGETK